MAARSFRLSDVPSVWWVTGGAIAGLILLRSRVLASYASAGTSAVSVRTTPFVPAFLPQRRPRVT